MRRIFVATLFAVAFASPAVAQELPKFPTPLPEHAWLQQFIGEWESEGEGTAGPGQPAMKCKGTMHTKALGGFWVVSNMKTEAMGASIDAIQTLGYDPQTKKYVGTWVDSMLGHLWKYDGSVDAGGKVLTLEATGPNCMQPGKQAKYRDVYEFKSKDHIRLTSAMQGDDGAWVTFMTSDIRRKK